MLEHVVLKWNKYSIFLYISLKTKNVSKFNSDKMQKEATI